MTVVERTYVDEKGHSVEDVCVFNQGKKAAFDNLEVARTYISARPKINNVLSNSITTLFGNFFVTMPVKTLPLVEIFVFEVPTNSLFPFCSFLLVFFVFAILI